MKKRGSEKVRAAATATYSTRFDAHQRELIDEAVRLTRSSPAQLIRDASVRRAADVVNASGGTRRRCRRWRLKWLGT
jgi:uncharacterized protein (DUF1778 family)